MSKDQPQPATTEQIVNTCCFALIHACRDANAKIMKIKHENVKFQDLPVGDWEVTVRRIKQPKKNESKQAKV